MPQHSLLIFGEGPVALCAALAAHRLGFCPRLVRRAPPANPKDRGHGADPRAWALRPTSLQFLDALDSLPKQQALVRTIEAWHADRHGTPLPGTLSFQATEHSLLSAIVPNADLRQALEAEVARAQIAQIVVPAQAPLPDPLAVRGDQQAALALICTPAWVAALPAAVRPKASTWAYDQVALSARVQLARPHKETARQVFLPTGPLALLPLPDPHEASLIWSAETRTYAALKRDPDLPARASACLHHPLDFDPNDLVGFSLSASHTRSYLGNGFVLLGEAAHRVHPLAGQGLNLGLADVGALMETLVAARAVGADLGTPLALAAYQRHQHPRNEAMRMVTDQLFHLFGADGGLMRLGRSLGLMAVNGSALKTRLQTWMSDPQPLCPALNRQARAPAQAT